MESGNENWGNKKKKKKMERGRGMGRGRREIEKWGLIGLRGAVGDRSDRREM
jgi:hypothetical protein